MKTDATVTEPSVGTTRRPRLDLTVLLCAALGLALSAAGGLFVHARLAEAAPEHGVATAWAIFLGGGLATLLMAAQIHTQNRRTRRVERQMAAGTQALLEANRNLRRHAEAREASLAALRQSEARYRLLADNANDVISRHAPNGEITYVSPSVRSLLGHDPEALVGRNAYEMFPAQDVATTRQHVRALMDEGRPFTWTYRVRHRDGHDVWIETVHRVLPEAEGSEVLCISRDITARRSAEGALRDSEAMFRAVFEHSAVGMGMFSTADGRYLRVNHALAELLGYSVAEFEELSIKDITHPADESVTPSEIQQVLSGDKESFIVEKRYLHKNGSTVWILGNTTLIRHANGEPRYFVAQIQDISDRKRVQERLARLTHQQDLILNTAGEGICGVDRDGMITFVNRAAAETLGYQPAELVERRIHALDLGAPGGHDWQQCRIFQSIRDRETHYVDDETFRHRDGRMLRIQYVSSPIIEHKRATGAVVAFTALTAAARRQGA